MRIGQLTRDVRLLATGFSRTAGKRISDKEIPPAVWEQWVEEGIIILPEIEHTTRRERAKMRRREKVIK